MSKTDQRPLLSGNDRFRDDRTSIWGSPFFLLVLVAGSIFTVNFLVTLFLELLGWLPVLRHHALIDSAMLTLTVFPVIYFSLFRPLTRHLAQVRQAREEIRQLSGQLLNAAEEERQRLARQLHDDLGHALTGLQFAIDALVGKPPGDPDRFQAQLGVLSEKIRELNDGVRHFATRLRPDILDDLGLVPTLRWLIETRSREREGLLVDFQAEGPTGRLTFALETILFQLCQESLSRLEAAGAYQIGIALDCSPLRIVLAIKGYGRGLSDLLPSSQGLLMRGLKERLVNEGGGMEIIVSADGETLIRAEAPLRR